MSDCYNHLCNNDEVTVVSVTVAGDYCLLGIFCGVTISTVCMCMHDNVSLQVC